VRPAPSAVQGFGRRPAGSGPLRQLTDSRSIRGGRGKRSSKKPRVRTVPRRSCERWTKRGAYGGTGHLLSVRPKRIARRSSLADRGARFLLRFHPHALRGHRDVTGSARSHNPRFQRFGIYRKDALARGSYQSAGLRSPFLLPRARILAQAFDGSQKGESRQQEENGSYEPVSSMNVQCDGDSSDSPSF